MSSKQMSRETQEQSRGSFYGYIIRQKGARRYYWKNMLFTSEELAELYLDQECLYNPEGKFPQRSSLASARSYEVESCTIFSLPETVKVSLSDMSYMSSMNIKLSLVSAEPSELMYSARFGAMGNFVMMEELGDYDNHEVVIDKDTSKVLGIRLEPEVNVLRKTCLLNLRGEGLPGRWQLTIGYRRSDMVKIFDEVVEG